MESNEIFEKFLLNLQVKIWAYYIRLKSANFRPDSETAYNSRLSEYFFMLKT